MTITDTPTDEATELVLSDHDYVVSDRQSHPHLRGFHLPWTVNVNLHLHDDTPIVVRVYDSEQRAVIRIGVGSAETDLYLNTVDQLDRLITVLRVARQRLR